MLYLLLRISQAASQFRKSVASNSFTKEKGNQDFNGVLRDVDRTCVSTVVSSSTNCPEGNLEKIKVQIGNLNHTS